MTESMKNSLALALEHIKSISSEEMFLGVYGFPHADYLKYCEDKQYEFEAQYLLDVMRKLECTEINLNDDQIQPPSDMFFHYLNENVISGSDDEFWDGWGASTQDVPGFPLRHVWVCGQGTEHFFQIVE